MRAGGDLADGRPRRRCRASAAACPQAVGPPAAGLARPMPGHGRARAASRGRGRDSPSLKGRAGKSEELGVAGNVYTRLMRQADALPAFEEAATSEPIRGAPTAVDRTRCTRLWAIAVNPRRLTRHASARSEFRRGVLESRRPEELCLQRLPRLRRCRLFKRTMATTWTRRMCTLRSGAHSSSGMSTRRLSSTTLPAMRGGAKPFPST